MTKQRKVKKGRRQGLLDSTITTVSE